MMKISIIGNGAIGNVLAFSCHQLKLDYQVITRNERPVQLAVTDSNNKQWQLSLPIVSLNALRQGELIILPLKAYQIAEFIEQNQSLIHNKQTLVLLHNGMGTIETVQKLLPHSSLIAATTSYGAFKPNDNSLHIKGWGESHFGWIKQQPGCQQKAIEQVLSQLLPPANWHQDIRLALWLKLAINAAINPLTALHNVNNGALRSDEFQPQIMALCEEITQLMTCLGFELKQGELVQRVNKVIADTADNFSSMNRDVYAKRQSEIDFINGYIAKQAIQCGLPCPVNLNLLNKIKALETKYLH
jgi:2-dehydropantoate 2-reductase